MTEEEFKERFLGKQVRIDGLHPGKDSPAYSRTGVLEQVWITHDECIAFSACHYTWTGIDYWRVMNGEWIGFYTSAAYSEPGMIRIVLYENQK